MSSFAIYRLPHADCCTVVEQTEGTPEELPSCAGLNGRAGFVLAPFSISARYPLLLIRPDRLQQVPVGDLRQNALAFCRETPLHFAANHHAFCRKTPCDLPQNEAHFAANRSDYTADFMRFHRQLQDGSFQKLVLSRCATVAATVPVQPLQLFVEACRCYPRLFIALVYTPQSGLWLTATPEILLDTPAADQWRTIALAGTMKLEGGALAFDTPGQHAVADMAWSTKNIQEQHYVATYLLKQLEPFVRQLTEEGPRTVRAANLVHLRSDFTFTLINSARVGDLLQALHPTPAVSGLPKQQAVRFILSGEHTPRQYYSGFMGPLAMHRPDNGHFAATHLYVTLRCMQIEPHAYRLYAGGGLLKESVEEQEWMETEAKMDTMRRCILAVETNQV
jgi:isochorismate synthase